MLRTVQRSIQIRRTDPGRRVVFGEVMIPAPDMEPGAEVRASDLDGRIHFDGAYMTEPEIVRLIDRFATKRPSVDVEHSGIPIAATVVESFQAREGDPEYHPGAWVAGVKIHDEDEWKRVERGDLQAFSIQFMVKVEEVPVTVILDDGAKRSMNLYRFSNGDPQYLSLVEKPATGALWKRVDRSCREVLRDATDSRWLMLRKVVRFQDLPLADRERAWDSDAATAAIFDRAGGETIDPEQAERGFVWVDAEDPTLRGSYKLPIADVVDGALTAVPRAVFAAAAAIQGARGGVDIPEADIDGAKAHVERYYAKMRAAWDDDSIVAPWDTERSEPEADVERSLGSGLMALVRRAFGMAKRAEDEGAEDATAEADDDEQTEETRADVLADYIPEEAATLKDAVEALFVFANQINEQSAGDADADLERMRAALGDFAQWSSAQLDQAGLGAFLAGVVEAPDEGEAEEPMPDEEMAEDGDEGERSVDRVKTFKSAVAGIEMGDVVWKGAMTLIDTINGIAMAEANEVPDKPGEMRKAVSEFAAWLTSMINKMAEEMRLAQLSFDPESIGRAGKKIKGARLAKLKEMLVGLQALIDELDDAAKDDAEKASKKRAEGSGDEGHADAPADAQDASEVARSGHGGESMDVTQLRVALEAIVQRNEALEERIRSIETARPPASGAGGSNQGAGVATPYDRVEILRKVMFPG